MKYKIVGDKLILTCDEEDRALLQKLKNEDPDRFDSNDFMYDWFEHLTCNSELEWVPEGCTSDLTSAPMLGIFGEQERSTIDGDDLNGSGLRHCGGDEGGILVLPLLYRWAFMAYALRSPQQDLLEKGEAVFVGGVYLEREQGNLICKEG